MIKKIIYGSIIAVMITVISVAVNYYTKIFTTGVMKNGVIFIKSDASLETVKNQLSPFISTPEHFNWLAAKKKFTTPKAGKYTLKKGMSLNELVNLLRSGQQTPVKVSFNNLDTIEKLAGKIAQQLEADSISLVKAMYDRVFLTTHGFTKKSVLGMYIPNTYEFYWNTSAEKFRNKMLNEYRRFWNPSRIHKAKKLQLTQAEVITLASIVQKETIQKSERPIVAGLYLNRLKNNWPLQADPTIIYCIKQQKGQNFVVKRVLNKDLTINSPYNTYIHVGLPPTLISMPDISAINAVLHYQKHHYYYMCASIKHVGYHEFASTLAQHRKNAAKYRRWIQQQGIHR